MLDALKLFAIGTAGGLALWLCILVVRALMKRGWTDSQLVTGSAVMIAAGLGAIALVTVTSK